MSEDDMKILADITRTVLRPIPSVPDRVIDAPEISKAIVNAMSRQKLEEIALGAAITTARLEAEKQDADMEIRLLMWSSHGHLGRYGDDGEMQCSECAKFGAWDYARAPIADVRRAFNMARLEQASKPTAAKQGDEN